MENKISPFLWFNSRGKEALNFYVSVFKDAKVVHDGDVGGGFYVGSFSMYGVTFHVLDSGPGHADFSEATSFMITCDDQAETDYYWNALTSDGGKESMCGWLVDKFGVSWQVTPRRLMELMGDPDPQKSGRVAQAMMQMQKIVIADLEKAAQGE